MKTRIVYVPLNTYPEAVSDDAVRAAVGFAAALGAAPCYSLCRRLENVVREAGSAIVLELDQREVVLGAVLAAEFPLVPYGIL